jgi:uncharacterized protein
MEKSNFLSALRTVLAEIEYDRCILFGSYARGDYTKESDLDILLVLKEPLPRDERQQLAAGIRRRLAEWFIPADVIICSVDEMEKYREVRGTVIRNALLEGVTV